MKDLLQIINKEFLLVARSGYGVFMPVAYLLIIMILFNISISFVDKKITQELIPLMIWISCLLICILNLETIFKEDYEDGSLEMFLINKKNIESTIIAKIFTHWVSSNFPVVIIAPMVALLLGLDSHTAMILFISLLIGTPSLTLIGSIAAALTISLRSNKILLSLMVLPLYIPILIYGTNAVNNSYFGISYQGEMTMMILLFIIFLLITPFTCAKALLVALD